MSVQLNFDLKAYHTFGIATQAQQYISIKSEEELRALLPLESPYLMLGGGSNILFTKDYEGLVIHNQIKGIEIIAEEDAFVKIKIGGGEIWHNLVLWAIQKGYSGIENLSLIPGTVGAAPIQNIGAYGVELKDVFDSLEAINIQTGQKQLFDKAACQFGYRESVFKKKYKGKYAITKVILKLSKIPVLKVSYGAIQTVLDQNNSPLTMATISEAIIKIRRQKLPDPKQIGNSGSFFKNPIISIRQYEALKKQYSQMPFYPMAADSVKIPAGWLIDYLGWKGYRKGDAGVHPNQALVLVNYGKAKGSEIAQLASEIQKNVQEKFAISLSAEVNIL